MRIPNFKREKNLKYTEKQAEKAKNLGAKLSNMFYRTSCFVILDNEKYFTLNGSNMPVNDRYYSNDREKCQDDVRFVGKDKYPKKILVWMAFSSKGMSKPLIFQSKFEAVDSDTWFHFTMSIIKPKTMFSDLI